jgi:hypothetical protein
VTAARSTASLRGQPSGTSQIDRSLREAHERARVGDPVLLGRIARE